MTEDIEDLIARVRVLGAAPVVVELQWSVDEDDEMQASWVLALHVIVAKPGPVHGAYTSVPLARLPAEQRDARANAHARGRALADALGVALDAPPVDERGGHGGSRWLRAQRKSVEATYDVAWKAVWWTDDGERHDAAGSERVRASNGEDARAAVDRMLDARLAERPLRFHTFIDGVSSPLGAREAPVPTSLPPAAAMIDLALAHPGRPSRVAAALVGGAPHASPRALMLAFHAAFPYVMEVWEPLAQWRRGECTDAALDAQLGPRLEQTRPQWSRAKRLHAAREARKSIAAFVRAERETGGSIDLIIALRGEFDVDLPTAKHFVDACVDAAKDAELNALLTGRTL